MNIERGWLSGRLASGLDEAQSRFVERYDETLSRESEGREWTRSAGMCDVVGVISKLVKGVPLSKKRNR